MSLMALQSKMQDFILAATDAVTSTAFYVQLAIIAACYCVAYLVALRIRKQFRYTREAPSSSQKRLHSSLFKLGKAIFPVLAIVLLKVTSTVGQTLLPEAWLLNAAVILAIMLFTYSLANNFIDSVAFAGFIKWVGLPLLFLFLIGVLPIVVETLEGMAINIGNIEISAYGVSRVVIFGGLLFWLGRASNTFGQDIIRSHKSLDVSTKEVFAKLFEVALFCIIFLLLLNIMGVNLTALAVFGGALGVGLGLGLQSIASNFISGIIILLDRSLTVGDYVELEDGQKGIVRQFKMRYAVLETFDGKDILVPNEKFISSLLINWTHKDPKQRYRIDFSVAYKTDIRAMVEIIKDAVSQHPQVIAGDDVPFEERPDCEIDSFGDSGVNMFVEFWMEGVDDGKNRVGGDLLLMVFETLREHGIEIPFPQREVRVLNDNGPALKNTTP